MSFEDITREAAVRLDPAADPESARKVLEAVVASEQFAKAERLKSFLTYVVEEAIAGRSATILGKTIAQDVYGRGPSGPENAENLVRVDARRLRRKLDEYYEGEGAADRFRIVIEPGGYAPALVNVAAETSGAAVTSEGRTGRWSIAVGLTAVAVVVVGALIWSRPSSVLPEVAVPATGTRASEELRRTERDALSLKSAASVQATNLCDQARGFLFPIADVGGQKLAIDTFAKAIETDPALACGHAGAAHAAATLAILSGDGEEAGAMKQRALSMSRTAVELAPTNGWSQSAAAWAAYADGRTSEAERLSSVAVDLAPSDGNVLDFSALIAVLTGNFDEALAASDPDISRDFGSFRFARRNLRGVAWFHTGEFDEAIRSLEEAIRNGDPVSALTLTYLAAAHQSMGEVDEAQRLARELTETWPSARPDIALERLYSTQALAQQVLGPLVQAGWSPEDRAP